MPAIEGPADADLFQSHAVADEDDDVLDFLGLDRLYGNGLVGDGDRVLVVCAELVVRIFGEVPALVGLGECGQAEAGPQQQEDDPFHGYLLISK